MKKLLYVTPILLFVVSVMMVNHSYAKALTLRVGHDIPPFASPAKGVDAWANLVNQKTDGRVKVEVFPSSTLSDQKSSLDMLQAGAVDAYLINFASHRTLFPLLSVESLPGLGFPDTVEGHLAHNTTLIAAIEKYPSVAKEVQNLKIVMVIISPNSVLVSCKKNIHVPEDIRGVKVGGNGARLELIKAIGAAPVFDVVPEAYQKLQTGVLEATTIPFQAVGEFKIYEVAKYALDISWGQGGLPLVMSRSAWDKLPDQDQSIVLQAGLEGQMVAYQAAQELTEKGKIALLTHGGQINVPSAEERIAWNEKFKLIWLKWVADNEAAGAKEAKSILEDWQKAVAAAWNK